VFDSFTPNKGLPYLFDGSPDNAEALATSLRALDVISNLVLESTTQQQSPLEPVPGQAWFIEKGSPLDSARTAGDDDFWTQTFGSSPRDQDLIVFFGVIQSSTAVQGEQFGWSGVPVQESAYGYIKDLGGRYQWDGEEWLPQQKIQTLIFRQGFNAPAVAGLDPPNEVPSPGGIQYYQVAVAPFDMQVTFVEIMHHGYSNIASETSPAAVLPGIYFSSNNQATFPASWTALVDPGYTGASGGWAATSSTTYANEVHTTGGVVPDGQSDIFTTVIPSGSYIAIGGWSTTVPSVNQTVWSGTSGLASLDTIAEIQIRFDYFDATT
jgi:hypothetical protein